MPTPFGYATTISDSRVSLGSKTFDCLQKIHLVQRGVVAGFAGNVMAGFALLDVLSELLSDLPDGCGWTPEHIGHLFPNVAAQFWREFFPGSAIALQLVTTHPVKDNGIPGNAMPHVLTFRSPSFECEMAIEWAWVSIGSGSAIHADAIRESNLDRYWMQFGKMEASDRGGFGRAMALIMYGLMEDRPDSSVGGRLQSFLLWRHETQFFDVSMERIGDRWVEHQFDEHLQPLCRSWSELETFLRSESPGIDASSATALGPPLRVATVA